MKPTFFEHNKHESIPVACGPPTCQPYVLWWLPLGVSTSGGVSIPGPMSRWWVDIHTHHPPCPLVHPATLWYTQLPSGIPTPLVNLLPTLWYIHLPRVYLPSHPLVYLSPLVYPSPNIPSPHPLDIPTNPNRDLGPGIYPPTPSHQKGPLP